MAIHDFASDEMPLFARKDSLPRVNVTAPFFVTKKSAAPWQYMHFALPGDHFSVKPAVYILASKARGTLYVGVTSDLVARVWQHKSDLSRGFTQKYGVHTLVYFEMHETMYEAISREKQLKAGMRAKKIALIEANNPNWKDLYPNLL